MKLTITIRTETTGSMPGFIVTTYSQQQENGQMTQVIPPQYEWGAEAIKDIIQTLAHNLSDHDQARLIAWWADTRDTFRTQMEAEIHKHARAIACATEGLKLT